MGSGWKNETKEDQPSNEHNQLQQCQRLLHLKSFDASIKNYVRFNCLSNFHTNIFPRGVVHRVEIGWGLTKVAVVLLNGLTW